MQTICDAPGTLPTGSWSDNGVILFGVQHNVDTTIYRDSATGGSREIALARAIRPHWLPGGRGFLYADEGPHPGVYLHADALESPRQLVALEGNQDAVWAFTFSRAGYLYVNRGGALTVQGFDAESLSLSGAAVSISGPAGTPSIWMAASAAADRLVALVPRSADDFGNPGDPLARLKMGQPVG